ncbi:MAG: DUF1636 family protein, partial [Pseudomonadota bacterium]
MAIGTAGSGVREAGGLTCDGSRDPSSGVLRPRGDDAGYCGAAAERIGRGALRPAFESLFSLMSQPSTIYVCATCRPADHDDAEPRPGARLAAEVTALAEASGAGIAVKAVQCLSVCKRPCAVAVSGPGK